MIFIDNGKTVKEYYTDKIIEKVVGNLLNRMKDVISSETFEGYMVAIKEREIRNDKRRSTKNIK